jgi:hypothetical protein
VRIVPFIPKNRTAARGGSEGAGLLIDNPLGASYAPKRMEKTGFEQFLEIMLKPDNIPIVGLMFLIFFFSWLAFREARKNDQLIEEGRKDEILKEMQE